MRRRSPSGGVGCRDSVRTGLRRAAVAGTAHAAVAVVQAPPDLPEQHVGLVARRRRADLIARVFAVIAVAGQHTFQVLTKRPGRMCSLLGDDGFWDQAGKAAAGYDPSPEALDRDRRPVPAESVAWGFGEDAEVGAGPARQARGDVRGGCAVRQLRAAARRARHPPVAVGWAAVGDRGWRVRAAARPMHPDWARSLRDQCQAAGVPYFFKLLRTSGGLETADSPNRSSEATARRAAVAPIRSSRG